MNFARLPVNGSVEISLLIQAPASVDDPTTDAVETERVFPSRANLINSWQEETDVYIRGEWLMAADSFTMGLRAASENLTVENKITGDGRLLTRSSPLRCRRRIR